MLVGERKEDEGCDIMEQVVLTRKHQHRVLQFAPDANDKRLFPFALVLVLPAEAPSFPHYWVCGERKQIQFIIWFDGATRLSIGAIFVNLIFLRWAPSQLSTSAEHWRCPKQQGGGQAATSLATFLCSKHCVIVSLGGLKGWPFSNAIQCRCSHFN